MDRELVNDYLLRAGMDAAQAEVLSRILADMEQRLATKDDLRVLEAKMQAKFETLEHKLQKRLNAVQATLTWRMVGLITLLATVIAVLDRIG